MPQFLIDFQLKHDGEQWRLYAWDGLYWIITPDFSNMKEAVINLLKSNMNTTARIADSIEK